MSKQIFVFCEGRSGSSLTSGIIHRLGFNMGDNLKGSSTTNKKGYYEDVDVKPLIRRAAEGKSDERLTELAEEWIEKRNIKDNWGVKAGNRRLNLAFPYIYPLVDNPHAVVCRRKEKDQVSSMQRAIMGGKNTYEEVKQRIDETYEIIEEQIEEYDLPNIDIHYEKWFEDPTEQMLKLCDFLEVEPTDEAYKFIDPNLRNFK